jgi:energy-coupling factor transport system ATP-binding protein
VTRVLLDRAVFERGPFRLEADCSFGSGLHVVAGRIGSGKSTLALGLAGGLRPVSGALRLEGVRRRLLVLQSPDHHLTGPTVGAEASSWGAEPGPLLDRVGLAARAGDDPFRLSRGEQKRLVLGSALMTDTDFLILDEPFASLDVPARVRLGRALAAREGVTVVMTHADRHLPPGAVRWLIRGGRVVSEV